MFEEIRKCLDEFEITWEKIRSSSERPSKEEEGIIIHLNLNLAKALMQDEYVNAERVAKIILAAKGCSEVVVKIE